MIGIHEFGSPRSLHLGGEDSGSLHVVEHGCDGRLQTLHTGTRGTGLTSGIVRVHAGKVVCAALDALGSRAVAANLLLATWCASLAESATGRRARNSPRVSSGAFHNLVWARHLRSPLVCRRRGLRRGRGEVSTAGDGSGDGDEAGGNLVVLRRWLERNVSQALGLGLGLGHGSDVDGR